MQIGDASRRPQPLAVCNLSSFTHRAIKMHAQHASQREENVAYNLLIRKTGGEITPWLGNECMEAADGKWKICRKPPCTLAILLSPGSNLFSGCNAVAGRQRTRVTKQHFPVDPFYSFGTFCHGKQRRQDVSPCCFLVSAGPFDGRASAAWEGDVL
uniref:Uncharacterized protein n=1 Tax=Steinernema glaseri TaxID=37863 RepID=A0A1I8A618_9BILA